MNNSTYIPCMFNVSCSMKLSYSFLWSTITLFLTTAITHAQDCAPSESFNVDVDISIDSDGAGIAAGVHSSSNTC